MNTVDAVASMRKSVLVLAVGSGVLALLGLALVGLGAGVLTVIAAVLLLAGALLGAALVGGGRLAIERQQRLDAGSVDLFLARNAGRSETAVLRGDVPSWSGVRRAVARQVFGHRLMVADVVRIRSLAEIRATLDGEAALDGLPFMPEMAAFCGQTARVYRVIDKVYDYGRSRVMRRLDDCVLLVGLRCDGSAHGGCQAACYLIWKAAWLEPLSSERPVPPGTVVAMDPAVAPTTSASQTYSCQYTQLTHASQASPGFQLRGWLGPLVVGNVSAAAFVVAALTRAFNAFQAWRGGSRYPTKPAPGGDRTSVGVPLHAGDWVRIKLPTEIAKTLDKNSKNRGLWFDDDMLKYCGQTFQVRGRVQQIIDVSSLAMIPMKTPCIMLEDVHYSGEFQGFGEQHDYLYWREAWLQRVAPPATEATVA